MIFLLRHLGEAEGQRDQEASKKDAFLNVDFEQGKPGFETRMPGQRCVTAGFAVGCVKLLSSFPAVEKRAAFGCTQRHDAAVIRIMSRRSESSEPPSPEKGGTGASATIPGFGMVMRS